MILKYIIKILMISCAFIILSVMSNTFIYYIPFIFIHEITHCLTAVLLGYSVKKIGMLPFGIYASFNEEFINPLDDIIITLSGPLINFIFFILFSMISREGFLAQINLILCIFNLLPAGILDGGRILKNVLKIHLSYYSAYYISNINGIILGCLVLLASVFVPLSFKNIILFIMGISFIYNGYRLQKSIIINITQDLLSKDLYLLRKKKRKNYSICITRDCKLIKVIRHFCFGKNHTIYVNIYGKSDRIFSEKEIANAYLSYGNIMISQIL